MNKKIKYLSLIGVLILPIIILISSYDIEEVQAVDIENNNTVNTIFVDIKGAVNNPGVYELNSDSRVIDLINEAGGLKENADTTILNLSKKLKDESYVIIYTLDETMKYKNEIISPTKIVKEIEERIICPDENNEACINYKKNNTLIDINTASKEELMTIPGIGESKANSIIEYRKNNSFNSVEDIKNVDGIGDSLYEKIKEYISI